jgi:general secretion pathway protein D
MSRRFLAFLLCVAMAVQPVAPAFSAVPAAKARAVGGAPKGLDAPLGNFDLRDVSVAEAIRLIAEVSGVNIVATRAVSDRQVSMYLRDATARGVIDTLARVNGLWYRYLEPSRTFILMSAEEFQRDASVFREEDTRTFRLKHHNVVAAANAVRALFGLRVRLSRPVEEQLGEQMKTSELRRADSNATAGGARSGTRAGIDGTAAQGGAGGGASAGAAATQQVRPEQAVAAATRLAAEGEALSGEEMQALRQGTEPPIHVTYNRLHNLLIVRTGDESAMRQVDELVRAIDLPARQVLLEMRIVQVALDEEFRRAFDVDLFGGGTTAGSPGSQAVNPLQPNATTGQKVVAALGNFALDRESTGIFQFINSRVRARLQLLEEKGRVRTLARPMVLASNNEPARLFIGEEVVLITGATSQTTTAANSPSSTTVTAETEQRDVGTTLVVHPRINDDRSVTLTIDQEISRRVRGGTTIPLAVGNSEVLDYPIDTVETSNIQVAALAKDGLTIALGGLIRAETSTSRQQVPGFGDIPVIGNLFSRDVNTDERTEMVLLVTPHIIDTAEEGDRLSRRQMSPMVEQESARLSPRRDAEAPPQAAAQALPVPAPARPAAEVVPATGDPAVDAQARYVRLTRHALLAWRDAATAALDPAIAPREVPRRPLPLWPDASVRTLPLAAWQEGELFVTLMRMQNEGDAELALDPRRFRGQWRAATVEQPRLAARDRGADAALVVLVSERPAADILEERRP